MSRLLETAAGQRTSKMSTLQVLRPETGSLQRLVYRVQDFRVWGFGLILGSGIMCLGNIVPSRKLLKRKCSGLAVDV